MSAELLREAAARIRKDQDIEEQLGHTDQRTYQTWLAVAQWLDACALVREVKADSAQALALAVARTYLGESA